MWSYGYPLHYSNGSQGDSHIQNSPRFTWRFRSVIEQFNATIAMTRNDKNHKASSNVGMRCGFTFIDPESCWHEARPYMYQLELSPISLVMWYTSVITSTMVEIVLEFEIFSLLSLLTSMMISMDIAEHCIPVCARFTLCTYQSVIPA